MKIIDLKERLDKWRFDRHLDYEGQEKGLISNIREEIEELMQSNDKYEYIDAYCDIMIFLLNTDYTPTINYNIQLNDIEPDNLWKTLDNNIEDDLLSYNQKNYIFNICYHNILLLGYDPISCLDETIKEIESRTGHWDEKQNKFIKDNKGTYKANYVDCIYKHSEDKYIRFYPTLLSKYNTLDYIKEVIFGVKEKIVTNSTLLGSLIHKHIESDGNLDYDLYMNELLENVNDTSSLDFDYIKSKYNEMKDFVLEMATLYNPTLSKKEVKYTIPIYKDIHITGIVDRLYENGELVDYKTTKMHSQQTMTDNYRRQLYCYVWMLNKLGIKINKITLIFFEIPEVGRISEKTGKPMKDYPNNIQVVSEEIDYNLLIKIDELLVNTALATNYMYENRDLFEFVTKIKNDDSFKPEEKPEEMIF